MTVYGYVRVKPNAVAGTANMVGWWLQYQGCEQVYADVWVGHDIPPALDMLLDVLRPGDQVWVPGWDTLGPRESRNEAKELICRRGVRLAALGLAPPKITSRTPPKPLLMAT